ncbi:hypothetical protein MPLDJ20_80130 [Mesorhizobium plurifarium]|uniref:Uncharacterized protein n=1 Tax=Mesorhizobium plurifarium TaxID=69974 RepID=A0A090FQ25_MESPL|nr:hypothetical protein MPLDJ20_80130 [Mesorhizobium plurifarium]
MTLRRCDGPEFCSAALYGQGNGMDPRVSAPLCVALPVDDEVQMLRLISDVGDRFVWARRLLIYAIGRNARDVAILGLRAALALRRR